MKVTCFPREWPGKTVIGRKATWAFKEGMILTEPPASSHRMESVSGAETGMWILIECAPRWGAGSGAGAPEGALRGRAHGQSPTGVEVGVRGPGVWGLLRNADSGPPETPEPGSQGNGVQVHGAGRKPAPGGE